MESDDFRLKVYAILKEQGLLQVDKIKFTYEPEILKKILQDNVSEIISEEVISDPIN
jgi:hypothetical protein